MKVGDILEYKDPISDFNREQIQVERNPVVSRLTFDEAIKDLQERKKRIMKKMHNIPSNVN